MMYHVKTVMLWDMIQGGHRKTLTGVSDSEIISCLVFLSTCFGSYSPFKYILGDIAE